jgi:chromosome partitioning protein
MIVVVGGIKGGAGKTTIATNLAVMRAASGKKVLLVDADEQKSSSIFANQREASGIETTWITSQFCGIDLKSKISKVKAGYDDIIIDVGGRDTTSQRSALAIADIYLLPFNPSSFDVWTLSEVKSIIKDMSNFNEKLKAYAFINRADPTGSDNDDARSILEECEELECLKLTIGNRKAFRSSSSDGLSVTEMKNIDKKAVQEMTSLYDCIYA